MSEHHIEIRKGSEIRPWLPELARLRISVFREYPYLYDGDMEYELNYLQTYAECEESLFVLAKDGGAVVGVSTAIPLAKVEEAFRDPFEKNGYDVDAIFYFGESVLDKRYRGNGLGKVLMELRIEHAASIGSFKRCAFCAVQRADWHPRKPVGYRPLDAFWRRVGFEAHPELRTKFAWKDLDEDEESLKPMQFWLRDL